MEKREFVLSYREIGEHVVKLTKLLSKGSSGYFNQYIYKLIIDSEVVFSFDSCSNLTYKSFKNIYKNINGNNIDLLIKNFMNFSFTNLSRR